MTPTLGSPSDTSTSTVTNAPVTPHSTTPCTCANGMPSLHPLDVVQHRRAGRWLQDSDDVEADLGHMHLLLVEPAKCESTEPTNLARPDGLNRAPVPLAGAGLDLADNQARAIAGDDIELAKGASPISRENRQALALQVRYGEVLPVPPECILCVHRPHPLGAKTSGPDTQSRGRASPLWTKDHPAARCDLLASLAFQLRAHLGELAQL